jgi:hypothetical protein
VTWEISLDRLAALTGDAPGRLAAVVVLEGRRAVPLLGRTPERFGVLVLESGVLTLHGEEQAEHAPVSEVRARRLRSNGFALSLGAEASLEHHVHGYHQPRAGEPSRARELAQEHRALTLVPSPPDMPERQYQRILSNRRSQQLLWRELWLAALSGAGAHVVP